MRSTIIHDWGRVARLWAVQLVLVALVVVAVIGGVAWLILRR